MTIEVGKFYKNRMGHIFEIIRNDNSMYYPMVASGLINGGLFYLTEHGRNISESQDSDYDLIEEVKTDENERTT